MPSIEKHATDHVIAALVTLHAPNSLPSSTAAADSFLRSLLPCPPPALAEALLTPVHPHPPFIRSAILHYASTLCTSPSLALRALSIPELPPQAIPILSKIAAEPFALLPPPAFEASLSAVTLPPHPLTVLHEAVALTAPGIAPFLPQILSHASTLLLSLSPPRALRASLSTLQALLPHLNDISPVLTPTLAALRSNTPVASDIATLLSTALDILDLPPDRAVALASDLCAIFASASTDVRHAIAEIGGSLVEANVEAAFDTGRGVAELEALMRLCVRSPDNPTFEAGLMAWEVWLAAASVSSDVVVKRIVPALPAVVSDVLRHVFRDRHADVDGDCRLQAITLDTLHLVAHILGVAPYVDVVRPWIESEAGLFALAAAGDVACAERDLEAISAVLPSVVAILADGARYPLGARRAAANVLSAFAHVLLSDFVDADLFSRALTAACASLLDVGIEAALFLREAAEARPERLLPSFLLLIDASHGAVAHLLTQRDVGHTKHPPAAEVIIHALALAAAELPDLAMRSDAVRRITACALSRLRELAEGGGGAAPEIARCLRVLSCAVRNVNDSAVATALLETLSPLVTVFSRDYAQDISVAPSLCYLLEVCVAPTVSDHPESCNRRPTAPCADDPSTSSRHALACLGLASEAFLASGESSWLATCARLMNCVISAPPADAEVCLSAVVDRTLRGLKQFASAANGGLDGRPDMVAAFLQLANAFLDESNPVTAAACISFLLRSTPDISEVAMLSLLRGEDSSVMYLALTWWARILAAPAQDISAAAVGHVGGSQALCNAVMATVGQPRATRRSLYLAADTVISLARRAENGHVLVINIPPPRPLRGLAESVEIQAAVTEAFKSGDGRRFRRAIDRVRVFCYR